MGNSMKIKKARLLLLFILLLLVYVNGSCQTAGKIYSKAEANTLFGSVIESVRMNADQFKSIIQQSTADVMVRVLNGELTILGDGRSVLFPEGKSVRPDDVFRLYSKSKVAELLGCAVENVINVEKRSGTITVTYGLYTLEEGWPCPPDCGL
jgi:hypothetical protein